jgi:probable dihydroxyacetone kinase regulator
MTLTTKRALAASLKKLLSKTTLDKITVIDIVEDCGVNRQTFYYHFQNIYDLMEWIFTDEVERVLAHKKTYDTLQESFLQVFNDLRENKDLVLNTYHSVNREHLEKYLTSWLQSILYDIASQQAEELTISEEDKNFIIDIYVLGFVGLALDWVGGNMGGDYTDAVDRFFKFFINSLKNA